MNVIISQLLYELASTYLKTNNRLIMNDLVSITLFDFFYRLNKWHRRIKECMRQLV